MTLEGKTVFITGGARGIGLGIAMACAKEGATLAIADIDHLALEAARAQLAVRADVRTYVIDVTDRAGVAAIADQVESDLGPVYGLFNNAGIIDSVSPAKMQGETWDWVINVNLNGVYNCLQAFVPRMIARKQGGLVVNTSSMAGMVGASSGFAYCASKFAVVGLSESLREELAHHNINVCVIVPGQVATSIVQNTRELRPDGAEQHSDRVNAILDTAHQSLLINGTPHDVAGRRIVESALANRPYIFTDNLWGPIYLERHNRVMDSLAACFPETAGVS